MFRKTPLAWLQVTREKTRLAVAIAGIAFADILIFVQLGFQDALFDSAVKPHQSLQTDLVLINPQFETFAAVKQFNRERVYQAQGVEGVKSVTSLYIGMGQWRNPTNRTTRGILIFGIDPGNITFNLPDVNQNLPQIQMFN
jgi:putative ABC transport system permease protein